MKILLAGEGKTELGDWAKHPSYRQDPPEGGLLQVLLGRVKPDGWTIADGVRWKDIHKYRAHKRTPPEVRNVLGLVVRGRHRGCDAVIFSRDRDRDRARERDLLAGITTARGIPGCPAVAGGMAIEAIESWVASMQGRRKAQDAADPAALLSDHGLKAMREVAQNADLAHLPADATSLRSWLAEVARVLGTSDPTLGVHEPA